MTSITVRGVASTLAAVLAVLVLGAFVVQAVPGVVGADASYVVLSGSMEPEISPGDSVVVKSVDPAELERGDVVTFTRSGESTPVTHRVVEVVDEDGELAFRTKGDNNDDADPAPVSADRVTGEVWFAIPYVGHVVMFANTQTGLAVLVGLPVVSFVVSELYAFARGDSGADDGEASTASENRGSPGGDDVAADPDAAADTDAAADPDVAAEEVPADATTVESAAAETSGDGVAVTPIDLKLSSVGFGALGAYSGYVAYLDPTPLHVAVFAGAAMVVVFVAVILASASESSPDERAREAESATPDPEDAATDGGTGEVAPPGGDGDGE